MKNIILGLMTVPFFALPGLAYSDEYMDGYTEGLKVGTFIAYCVSLTSGMYASRSENVHMLRENYRELDAGNQRWAREKHPECVFR
jgi:hypothetical protein